MFIKECKEKLIWMQEEVEINEKEYNKKQDPIFLDINATSVTKPYIRNRKDLKNNEKNHFV
jgi:hypothetical protein